MEKRVFLAILLSFAVLAGYQAFFAPKPDQLTSTPPAPTSSPLPPQPAGATPSPAATQAPGAPVEQSAPSPQPLVADTAAHDIVVDTDAVHAVFTTAGGALKSWRLKRYLDEKGEPLELVPAGLQADLPKPFTLASDDPALSARVRTALYQPSAPSLTLGSSPGTLSFEFRDASGLTARKTFHLQPDGKAYVVTVEATIDVAGASKPAVLEWGPALGLGYKPDGSREVPPQGVILRDTKPERLPIATIAEQPRYDGTFRFAGVEEQYFMTVAMPGTQTARIEYRPITLPVPDDAKGRSRNFIAYSVGVSGPAAMSFFMGPKDLEILRAVDPQLVRAIDFGFFAVLVVPMLRALKWLYGILHNWGWSIVALTIIINLLMFPLRHRSMVSMKKMQALQPQIKSIQDRYAKYKVTDPERQKMQQEMLALYKQKGVHPASGCLPMLLTLPVLYAFYQLLSSAIELRGAPFFGWIKDLALHDPYYVTPVVMGLTMFWQQRTMPSTADPVQRRIFLLMPIVFTVTFLWAPSGLVIYWLVSNLLTIGQQYLTNRITNQAPRPPAKKLEAGARA
jgi:YidC/Oxa1 family membrane protein insertase